MLLYDCFVTQSHPIRVELISPRVVKKSIMMTNRPMPSHNFLCCLHLTLARFPDPVMCSSFIIRPLTVSHFKPIIVFFTLFWLWSPQRERNQSNDDRNFLKKNPLRFFGNCRTTIAGFHRRERESERERERAEMTIGQRKINCLLFTTCT